MNQIRSILHYFRKEYYSYLGNVFAAYGILTAVVGYDLAPKGEYVYEYFGR